MPVTAERSEIHAGFRFAVQIDGIDEAVFTECSLPNLEVDVHEQKEGGYNSGTHLLAGPVKSGRITLKRGIAHSSELMKWYRLVADGSLKDAQRQVSVVMYDSTLEEISRWNFLNAYPVKWTGPAFKTADNTVAIETLELAFAEVSYE